LSFEAVALPLTILIAGGGILSLTIGTIVAIRGSSRVDQRLDTFITPPTATRAASGEFAASSLSGARKRFNNALAVLDSEEMERQLTAARWPITVAEFWMTRVAAAVLGFMLGIVVARSILIGLGAALLAYLVPGILLARGIRARQRRFESQLIDALTLIRGAVAAGYSFQQSLNVVIQELPAPMSEEFQQVRREVELGVPLGTALQSMADRMESADFNLVVTVVITNMEIGGNLTTILTVVMNTIRERLALFGEIRALTAYATFASYVLTLLPPVTVIILALLSPVYWKQLAQPGATRIMLIYAVSSVIAGNIVLRRIAKVDV
jgi:tight adherence protein B